MKFRIFAMLIFAPFLACAWVAQADEPIHIHPMNPAFDATQLKGPGVVVHPLRPKATPRGSLPAVRDRDRLLAQAGLGPTVEKWDDYDRDALFVHAQEDPLERLTARYPKIDGPALRKLKELATP